MVKIVSIASCALVFAGCGGSSNGKTSGPALTGKVIAGPLNGGTVTAYSMQGDGSNGASLGAATTAADGSFNLTLEPAPAGGVRLVASGGSYASEANLSSVISGAALSAVLPSVPAAGASGLVVTPLTTFADHNTMALLAATPATSLASAATTAEAAVSKIYGLQGGSPLATLEPDFSAASGDAATASLVLGSLEQLAVLVGKAPAQVTNAIAQDISDGVLDGKAAGGAAIKYASSDTAPAPSTLASAQFLNAVTSYADPANTKTQASKNGVVYSTEIVTALRGAVVRSSSNSSGLDISSSGAITSLTFADATGATRQTVYFAARSVGLKALDFTSPSTPTAIDLTALNTALRGGASPLLHSVDGAIAVPVGGANPQVLLYSFGSKTVALVDASTNTLIASKALTIPSAMTCSGASAFISGGVADTVGAEGLVWLTTGAGYLPVSVAGGVIAEQAAVGAANGVAMSENVGASVVDRALFAPGYCDYSSAGKSATTPGLTLFDFDKKQAFSLDAADYRGLAFGNFDDPDAGAVDTAFKVGIVVQEHSKQFSFIDLRGLTNPALYSFNTSLATVTPQAPKTQLKTITLSDLPSVSGVNINSAAHLAFIIEETGDHLAVASIDDPANPASPAAGWAGFTDYRFENGAGALTGSPTPFCAASDPHSEATISHFSNGRTYGFALNVCDKRSTLAVKSGALIVDLENFVAGQAVTGSHQLKNNPYLDTTVIQTIAF